MNRIEQKAGHGTVVGLAECFCDVRYKGTVRCTDLLSGTVR